MYASSPSGPKAWQWPVTSTPRLSTYAKDGFKVPSMSISCINSDLLDDEETLSIVADTNGRLFTT